MSAYLLGWTFSLPVVWARLYTIGLPSDERAARLDRIASDIFDQRAAASQDQSRWFATLEVLVCLARSVTFDLTWRFERGHALRAKAIREGQPPFPGFITALFALAGLAGAARLTAVHDLSTGEMVANTLALLAGPLISVLGVLLARQNGFTGIFALVAGSAALAFAAAATVIAPIAALVGLSVGLYVIFEHRHASRTSSEPGRTASPTSPTPTTQADLQLEVAMDTSEKLERWLTVGAVLVVAGFVTTILHDTSFPFDGTDAEIRDWYADGHEGLTYGMLGGGMASGIGLLVFFGSIFAGARRAEGGSGYLSALMFGGAAVAIAISMIETTIGVSVGMAAAYDDKFVVDPQAVRHIAALGYGLLAMASAGMAVALGALAAVALRSRRVCAQWLAWTTAVMAVLLLVSPALLNIPFQVVFVLWTVVFAVSRARRTSPITQTTATAATVG